MIHLKVAHTIQHGGWVCWANWPVSAKDKHVTVLVLHQDFTVILGLTSSYVLTHYPNQYFPLFLYCCLQNPVNFYFLYLDILTNLTIKLWVGRKFKRSERSSVHIINIVQQPSSLAVYKYFDIPSYLTLWVRLDGYYPYFIERKLTLSSVKWCAHCHTALFFSKSSVLTFAVNTICWISCIILNRVERPSWFNANKIHIFF